MQRSTRLHRLPGPHSSLQAHFLLLHSIWLVVESLWNTPAAPSSLQHCPGVTSARMLFPLCPCTNPHLSGLYCGVLAGPLRLNPYPPALHTMASSHACPPCATCSIYLFIVCSSTRMKIVQEQDFMFSPLLYPQCLELAGIRGETPPPTELPSGGRALAYRLPS